MNPAMKRFTFEYGAIADGIARADIPQEAREAVAAEVIAAINAQRERPRERGDRAHPEFREDTFRLLATDPLCRCAGPDEVPFALPCPHDVEIRVGMHLRSNPDGSGRSKAWRPEKPVVRCTPCGAKVHVPGYREAVEARA